MQEMAKEIVGAGKIRDKKQLNPRINAVRGLASNSMANLNSTNVLGLGIKMQEMAKVIVGAEQPGAQKKETEKKQKVERPENYQ